MINELYGLSKVLSEMNIQAQEWHPKYKTLPKVTFRIWLSRERGVCGIEELEKELVQKLRRYGNNQNSFPAFNIPPLYRITEAQDLRELEKAIKDPSSLDMEKVKSWCVQNNWRSSRVQQIERCLHKTSLELLEILKQHGDDQTKGVIELIRLANQFNKNDKGSLQSALETCIFDKLHKGENVAMMLTMLLHKGNPNKNPEEDNGTRSIILDFADWQQYRYPVASEPVTNWINEALLKEESAEDHISNTTGNKTDAFGAPYSDVGEPMPSVKLQGFDVTLRAMFHEQKCQYRYSMIDDVSYPIAKSNRARAKLALEWMAELDKENITWKKVDRDEVVFVYPSKLPRIPLKCASLFGPDQGKDPAQAQESFKVRAEKFIQTLKGLPTEQQPEKFSVFSIRKMDKARSKIVYNQNCSSKCFVDAAKKWQLGCENIPPLSFMEPVIPYPLQVARVANNIWKKNGELASLGKPLVKRMQYYQGVELLLDPLQQDTLLYYARILLENASGLISYVGNQHNEGKFCAPFLETETGLLLAVLGLILYKLDHKKEDYMENTAYLIGQMLKVSDELHVLYCKVIRNNEVPPQLAGNSVLSAALETPARAIALLGQRMQPYLSWAKQYRTKDEQDEKTKANKGKETWKAAWYLSLYEQIATKLGNVFEDTRLNDFGKAELFIGYLAAFPKKEGTDLTSSSETDETSLKY